MTTTSMTDALVALKEAIIADYATFNGRLARDASSTETRDRIRDEMFERFVENLEIEEGRKYIKVITDRSVWGFIMKEDDKKFRKGDILKAASWSAPARNAARGNILDGGYRINWTGPNYLK